jgi:hypothetical protein
MSKNILLAIDLDDETSCGKPLLSPVELAPTKSNSKRDRGFADSRVERDGFERLVPLKTLAAPLMAALQPQSVGGPAIARPIRREDRSAQLERGPENLGNRAAAN